MRKTPPTAPPPASIRLNHNKRERLEAEAAGMALGAYINAKALFEALAEALALLGQSRIASNLNQRAHLGNIGSLALTPEMQAELLAALKHVGELRALLTRAVGLKDGGQR